MRTDMADWPQVLRINVEAVHLAGALYRSKCEAFGPVDAAPFQELPQVERKDYITAASNILKLLRPVTPEERAKGVKPQLLANVSRMALRLVYSDGSAKVHSER